MPRTRHNRRPIPPKNELEAAAILLLSTAESPAEELLAYSVARLARHAKINNRYGPRGPYTAAKSEDFLDILLNESTDRVFRTWFR